MKKQAYPLSWPDGWKRTPRHEVTWSRFRKHGRETSMAEACHFLAEELRRLGASEEILSTNVRQRLGGAPVSGAPQPDDRGAALYFKLDGKDVVLACDRWSRVECNVYAIAKHIEALRGQDRWGVGSIEQSFRGYMALPEMAESKNWWGPLGLTVNAAPAQVKDAFRLLARKFHPDNKETGDEERFRHVQAAWEEFERQQNAT